MDDTQANLLISWRSVAVGATAIALSAAVMAAVVATIKKADTLSVVALAVATIAFLIQIIVFIVQAAATSQQELRAQQVYASTMKVLATIEEKTEGTRREVSTINERMLAAILGKAIPEVAATSSGESFASALAQRTAQAAGQLHARNLNRVVSADPSPAPRRTGRMYSFPKPGELERVLPVIDGITPGAARDLAVLGSDYCLSDVVGGFKPGLNLGNAPEVDELIAKRLLEIDPDGWDSKPVHVLTPDGVVAARLLLANDPPVDLPEEVVRWRSMARRGPAQMNSFIFRDSDGRGHDEVADPQ
jgi:hypothetical protein